MAEIDRRTRLEEPWLSFFRDVDRGLTRSVEIHCLGAFVMAVLWGLPRPTGDVDFIEVEPRQASDELLRLAGEDSPIARKHRIHLQRVAIAEFPADYASRLIDLDPQGLTRLSLRAFEVHDLVLAKLGRNSPKDRHDVQFLVANGALDPSVLKERYETELRPYVLNEPRHSLTISLWLNEFFGKG